MAQTSKQRFLQSVLLIVWTALVVSEAIVVVESQVCLPPLVTPGYMNPITIGQGAWRPASGNVIVRIDSLFNTTFVEYAAARIEEGHRKWNTALTCAGVNFVDFEEKQFTETEYQTEAPFRHVYWQVDEIETNDNGLTFSHIGFAGMVDAATIKIRPDLAWDSSSNPVYFNYLGGSLWLPSRHSGRRCRLLLFSDTHSDRRGR